MSDKPTYQERLKGMLHPERPTHQERLKRILDAKESAASLPKKEAEGEEAEISCGAFGFLRGIRDLPGALELRFRDGNSTWFPYGWLGPWQYNPSEGLLLKFSGDLVYLVLTTGGLQRHRVVWIREMSEEDIRQVGESGPTIDRIEVAEFESQDALREWLGKNAPAFLR
jgi:hypothetical protein